MEKRDLQHLFERVAAGEVSPADAIAHVQTEPFRDLGYAKIDTQRGIRQGVSEVVYGAGKSAVQIAGIIQALRSSGQRRVMATRVDCTKADEVASLLSERDAAEFVYHEDAEMVVVGGVPILMATDMWWLLPQAQATCVFRKRRPLRRR